MKFTIFALSALVSLALAAPIAEPDAELEKRVCKRGEAHNYPYHPCIYAAGEEEKREEKREARVYPPTPYHRGIFAEGEEEK